MLLMPSRVAQKYVGDRGCRDVRERWGISSAAFTGSDRARRRRRFAGALDESAEESTKFRCTSICVVMEKCVVRLFVGVVVFDISSGSGQVHLCLSCQ